LIEITGRLDVSATHRAAAFTGKGPVGRAHRPRKSYTHATKIHKTVFAEMWARSATHPTSFGLLGERRYWLFEQRWYWDKESLTSEQVHALLVTR